MRKHLIQLIKGNYDNKYAAVIQIIMVNIILFTLLVIAVFILFLFKQHSWLEKLLIHFYLPSQFSEFITHPWSIISFQFLHSLNNPFHILFNLLWLYWFGRIFNFYFGNYRVWFLYLVGGIMGGILFMLFYNVFPVFEGQVTYLIGASAGVTAIVIALATYLPNFEVFTLLGPIKLKWIAFITIILDFAMAPNGFNSGGHIAHLGGALFGFFYIYFYQKGMDFALYFINFWKSNSYKPNFRMINFENKNTQKSSLSPEKPSQQEIDRILDKIAEHGYDKLTKEEKQTLYNASKD